jgi:hypothetical protein
MHKATTLLGVATALSLTAPLVSSPSPETGRRNGVVLSKLIYTDIDTSIDGQTIEQVVQLISQYCDAPVRLLAITDTRSNGLDRELMITLPKANRPALNLLQDAIGQCSETTPATWQVRHGTIEVSTKEALSTSTMQLTKVLPIEDQLQEIPDYDNPPNLNLGGGGGGGGGGNTGGAFQFQDLETRRDELIEVLTHNIEPAAWTRNGGTWADIQPYRRTLVIRAPRWIHRQVTGLDFSIPRPSGRTNRTLRFVGDQIRVEVPLTERLKREASPHS